MFCIDPIIHTDPDNLPSCADKCSFGNWSLDTYHYEKSKGGAEKAVTFERLAIYRLARKHRKPCPQLKSQMQHTISKSQVDL